MYKDLEHLAYTFSLVTVSLLQDFDQGSRENRQKLLEQIIARKICDISYAYNTGEIVC